MKKIFQVLALGILTTVFVGCSKDDDDKSPSNGVSAVIDGESFKAKEVEGYYYNGNYEIYAYSNTMGVDIYIANIDEPGTYDLSEALLDGTIEIEFESEVDDIEMLTGTLVITKLTESRIEATFSGQGYNYETEETVSITKGVIKTNVEADL